MLRRSKAGLIVLLGYAAVSFAYEGWRLLPHPGRAVIGFGTDPEIFIWSFAWWPHAIATWTNPFVTHALYAPTGINLTWTPSSSGIALAFSPLTVLVGPVASYNVAELLLPALGAWTAYLLCRHLTGSFWASLVGGYLFGFSSANLGQQIAGHQHMLGVFLLPLIALVLVRYVEGELTPRGVTWRLGALLAAQLWISTELALTGTIILLFGLALAFALLRGERPRLRSSLGPIAGAYALGAVLAAPFVYYALRGLHTGELVNGNGPGADLLNLAVPTPTIGIGGSALKSVSSLFPSRTESAYLGLPTLLIVALFAVRGRRKPEVRFLVAALGVTVLIVLGTALRVGGHRLFALPWTVVPHLPLVKNALAFRFALYVGLVAGVIVALWTATTRGRVYAQPYVLPALAVAALVPAVWQTSYPNFRPQPQERLAFFTDDLYRTCFPRNETVVIFPFGTASGSLLWQAETGVWFRLAANGIAPAPKRAKPLASFDSDRVVFAFEHFLDVARPTTDSLLAFAALHHVDRVLTVAGTDYPSLKQMVTFGKPQLVGGMLVSPACGQPSLATRDLVSYVSTYQRAVGNVGYCAGGNFIQIPQGFYPAFRDARPANFVAGQGLTCLAPPAGYKRRGFATVAMSVPANTYPYYAP